MKILAFILLFIGSCAFGLFMAPATVSGIAIHVLICLILSLILVLVCRDFFSSYRFNRLLTSLAAVIVLFYMYSFYCRWSPSSSVTSVARLVHLSKSALLVIVSVILGIFALYFVDRLINYILHAAYNKTKLFHFSKKQQDIVCICLILLFQYLMLEISSLYLIDNLFMQGILGLIINLAFILVINLVISLITRFSRFSFLITSVFFFLWSVANYYTIQFHGSPLYISELANARTAAQVAFDYKYNISMVVFTIIVLFLVSAALVFRMGSARTSLLIKPLHHLVLLLLSVIIAGAGSYMLIQTRSLAWMPWQQTVGLLGFNVSVVNDLAVSYEPITEPEGYTSEFIEKYPVNDRSQAGNSDQAKRPDIIFILNETFYDLNYYTEINPDVDYMEAFYNIPGAIYGHAICSNIGGGTNNSEFELLTSKSMSLLNRPAPYTYLDNNIISRSIVEQLKSIGYKTTAMHCGGAANYARNTAYPAVGFDNIYLGSDQYSYINDYGNRSWLDSDNYKDMIDHYDPDSDAPQFMYLLTFQNHGGYEQNDDSLDTVHTGTDAGSLTDDINEFLTSVQLSAKAFRELTDYYAKVDRDVIICMAGDHAPPFISELTQREDLPVQETSINKRAVPYVIWSNFDADYQGYTEYASMVDLAPMVLKAAGLPLCAFYENVLELHELLPIRTREGMYMDKDLQIGMYSAESPYYDRLREYYYLEYNSLLEDEEYRSELFNIQIQ